MAETKCFQLIDGSYLILPADHEHRVVRHGELRVGESTRREIARLEALTRALRAEEAIATERTRPVYVDPSDCAVLIAGETIRAPAGAMLRLSSKTGKVYFP